MMEYATIEEAHRNIAAQPYFPCSGNSESSVSRNGRDLRVILFSVCPVTPHLLYYYNIKHSLTLTPIHKEGKT